MSLCSWARNSPQQARTKYVKWNGQIKVKKQQGAATVTQDLMVWSLPAITLVQSVCGMHVDGQCGKNWQCSWKRKGEKSLEDSGAKCCRITDVFPSMFPSQVDSEFLKYQIMTSILWSCWVGFFLNNKKRGINRKQKKIKTTVTVYVICCEYVEIGLGRH